MRTLLIILTIIIILLIPGVVFLKSEEPLFAGDADYHELVMTASDQLILDAKLEYYWYNDQTDYSTGTWKTIMSARVN